MSLLYSILRHSMLYTVYPFIRPNFLWIRSQYVAVYFYLVLIEFISLITRHFRLVQSLSQVLVFNAEILFNFYIFICLTYVCQNIYHLIIFKSWINNAVVIFVHHKFIFWITPMSIGITFEIIPYLKIRICLRIV